MKSIVAVDKNWGIGRNNDMLISIPDDMKHFITHTKDKVVVMGKNTLDSFPEGKPLKNRVNIVLSRRDLKMDNVIFVKTIDEIFKEIKKYNSDDILVVGGGSVYKQLLPYCSNCLITKILKEFEAEIFYPNLDEMDNWKIIEESEEYDYEGIKYKFLNYKNNNIKKF